MEIPKVSIFKFFWKKNISMYISHDWGQSI